MSKNAFLVLHMSLSSFCHEVSSVVLRSSVNTISCQQHSRPPQAAIIMETSRPHLTRRKTFWESVIPLQAALLTHLHRTLSAMPKKPLTLEGHSTPGSPPNFRPHFLIGGFLSLQFKEEVQANHVFIPFQDAFLTLHRTFSVLGSFITTAAPTLTSWFSPPFYVLSFPTENVSSLK